METTNRTMWLADGYAAAIFTSAFLLFQIQPILGKQILPRFGGSPAVWTTCLLFFQVALFAGYLYAHGSHSWLKPRGQVMVHAAILAAAIAILFSAAGTFAQRSEPRDPVVAILLFLSANIGLPYFALAATGPLLQAWFTRAFPGRIPFRLYALSNLGSLLALVSYPFVVEQRFELPQQLSLWTGGFLFFAVLCGLVAAQHWAAGNAPNNAAEPTTSSQRPMWLQYVGWLAWPAAASIVLMATTNHICADVAVIPFLWVAPLALYLLTFIIAFDHPRWYRPTLIAVFTLAAIYGTALVHREGVGRIDLYDCGMTGRCIRLVVEAVVPPPVGASDAALPDGPAFYIRFVPLLVLNLAAMFGVCLVCHGELVRQKPAPRYLTSFYVMIAAGGALGGAIVTLLAPRIFNTYFEWQLAMFAATVGMLAMILYALLNHAVAFDPSPGGERSPLVARLALIVLLLPASFVLLDMVEYLHSPKKGIRVQQRNFFGTFTVRERNPDDAQMNNFVLLHGVTVHGSQFTAPNRRGQPTTYYGTPSGVGRMLNFYRSTPPLSGLRIGSIGLGTGTLAAFAGERDSICFYEIDPDVVDLTTSGQWFTYVRDCQARGAKCDILLGDARLTLEAEERRGQPERYHALVADAFSGDAVPIHLLTTEAFELYLARLTTEALDGEDGALAVHASNRYLDLERVVHAAARKFAISGILIESPRNARHSLNSADWIILSRNEALMRHLAPFGRSLEAAAKPPIEWSDARNSLFEIVK